MDSCSRKIPHATGHSCAIITESVLSSPRFVITGATTMRSLHCNKEQPQLSATRESPRTAMKTQHPPPPSICIYMILENSNTGFVPLILEPWIPCQESFRFPSRNNDFGVDAFHIHEFIRSLRAAIRINKV